MDRPTGTRLGISVIPALYARRTVRDKRSGKDWSAFRHKELAVGAGWDESGNRVNICQN
jgi:hypothetical protein